jgi:hypothetical protein
MSLRLREAALVAIAGAHRKRRLRAGRRTATLVSSGKS